MMAAWLVVCTTLIIVFSFFLFSIIFFIFKLFDVFLNIFQGILDMFFILLVLDIFCSFFNFFVGIFSRRMSCFMYRPIFKLNFFNNVVQCIFFSFTWWLRFSFWFWVIMIMNMGNSWAEFFLLNFLNCIYSLYFRDSFV